MRRLGRLMQHVGLCLPPLAIVLQLLPGTVRGTTVITLGQMLMMLVAGACLFWIGRILEGYSQS